MTYQELTDRLTKCENTLKDLKDGSYKNISDSTKNLKIAELTNIKESLTKQLNEAQDKGIVYTDDEKKAKDLADDGINVKLTKEQEGVKFSVDETKSIAKSVGKAVAMSLKSLGDEIDHMKAKNIEENSFEIYVQYKSDRDDEFSFYIVEDTLHLTDFSFDKELTDVGVKPSGEAVVNVDVLANELTKHFKSMNEKVDSNDTPELKKLSKALKGSSQAHLDQKKKLDKLINTEGEVSEAPDNMYYIKVPKTDKGQQNAVQNVIETFYSPVRFADIVDDDGAGNVIMYIRKEDFQEGMIDDLSGEGVDIDSQTNFPTMNEDKDIGHQDDEPNMLGASAMETAEYAAKLVKKLQRYDQHDGEVDFPNWWQKKLILARDYMSAAYHYLDSEEKQPAIDQLALESTIKEGRGDLQTIVGIIEDRASDSGFSVEDEAEEVIEAIQDHYNLDMYGKQKGVEENVDKVAGGIPYKVEGNKAIITEPLDDATKERLIGKAKEHGYHAAPNQAGGITITLKKGMYEASRLEFKVGDKVTYLGHPGVITKAGTDSMDRPEYNVSYNKGNGDTKVTNVKNKSGEIKKGLNERLNGDQQEALMDLQNILDRAAQLGDEARSIIQDTFPEELRGAEAYDVFNFGSSSNSYDNTLESLISDIEQRFSEDEGDDLDEGRKDDDALFPDNPRLPEIKKLADNIISMVKAEAAKGELGYIRTMEEIRYQQEHDFERTPEWNKAKGIRSDFDDYGSDTNEGVAKTKKAHDLVVNKMKQLAKQYKSGDTSVISQLKDLTAKKKSLEAMLDRDVAGTGRDQELDEAKGGKYVVRPCSAKDQPWAVWKTSEGGEDDKRIKGFKTKPEAKAFADKKNGVDEAGPGFKHDCAAKVVHETYGKGNCIPEKHTLVKEGTKYVVTHYDVLFESGKTVKDIPVSELDIKTTNEHWHKGYKKKKK